MSTGCFNHLVWNFWNTQSLHQRLTIVLVRLGTCVTWKLLASNTSTAVPNMRLLLSDLMAQKNKWENVPPPTQRLILRDWLIDVTTKKWCVEMRHRMRCSSIKSSPAHNSGHSLRKVATSLVAGKKKAWTILKILGLTSFIHEKKCFFFCLTKTSSLVSIFERRRAP